MFNFSSSGDSGVGDRVVTALLTEIMGIEELHGVIIIAATNRPDLLDNVRFYLTQYVLAIKKKKLMNFWNRNRCKTVLYIQFYFSIKYRSWKAYKMRDNII